MKKLILSMVFCSLFFTPTSILSQKTSIDFKIKNIGFYVDGSFSKATATSNFEASNLSASFINAIVEIKSINTNNKKRDKHLLETEYFDEANYKQMELVSTKIEKISNNNYNLTGKLTIKNTTKTIVIPLVISENKQSIVINTNFELNRRDYGVGGRSWVMSNTVKINVKHTIVK